MKTRMSEMVALTLLLVASVAACDGDEGPVGPQGPPGDDGNANVTVHIYDGVDFTAFDLVDLCLGRDISARDMEESSWTVYLGQGDPAFDIIWWQVPGDASFGDSRYDVAIAYDFPVDICPAAQPLVEISRVSGPGEVYDEIRIVQVLANTIYDNRNIELVGMPYEEIVGSFGTDVEFVRH